MKQDDKAEFTPANRATAKTMADTKIDGVGKGDGTTKTLSAQKPRREADEGSEDTNENEAPGKGSSVMQDMIGGLGYGSADSKKTKMAALNL